MFFDSWRAVAQSFIHAYFLSFRWVWLQIL